MKIDRAPADPPAAPRRRAPQPGRAPFRLLRASSPQVMAALLLFVFGAGLLLGRAPDLLPAAPAALSPLAPTALPASPTPAATPTATAAENGDALETLYVEILPRDLERLDAKRQEALRVGILLSSDSDYVPALLRVGQEEIPVELRLKGDWADHFAGDKWSFRVRTRGEHYLWGMRIFSLQDPSTRSYLNEWLFLQNMRREGVLAVGYRFVHVVLNGAYRGIFALEEGFSKELFESQQRREGVMLCYDEDLVWAYRAAYDDQLVPYGVNAFYIIDEFQAGHVDSTPNLAMQRDAAMGMLRAVWSGERPAADAFDPAVMGRFLALTDLWSAPHGLIWHNLRYYYNPITTRLEPIAFDSDALAGDLGLAGLPESAFPGNPLLQRAIFFGDPELQAAYVRELWRVSQPGYVEALEVELGPQYEVLRAALEPEFGPDLLARPWDTLRERQRLARQVLDPLQMVYAYMQRPQPAPSAALSVDVGNLLGLPVEIVGLLTQGGLLPADAAWVDASSAGLVVPQADGGLVLRPLDAQAADLPYVHLNVPHAQFPVTATVDLPEIGIVTRLWGLPHTYTSTLLPGYPVPLVEGPLPTAPTVEEALAGHPYLQVVEGERMLSIPAGTWEVNGNLVLPEGYGLRLGPGTRLRFGFDRYLLVRGGPLDFKGREDAPIVLEPVGNVWDGLVVLDAGAPSAWEYVTVERASAVEQEGWALTGGITFYNSPVRLDRCRIVDAQGEDGINVVRARFEFVDSEFGPTVSDAFDADFGQGRIEGCSFHDTGGDGIDVSGSQVQVQDVRLLRIGDKGISVGEASQLTARDVYFEDVNFAMASKDLSRGELFDATIVRARLAGLAAYVKKASYGPASITASGITFVDTPAERYTLVQTGSWVDLEGVRVWGVEVDVEGLYAP